MYKIIGGDGRQYGPITKEQIEQWIAEGRANGQSLIQPEGAFDWRPISDFPEFAAALASQPPPQAAPPSGVAPDPDALVAEVLARNRPLDIGSCFGRAWGKLAEDFWPIVGVSALMSIVIGLASSIIILNGPLLGGLLWYYLKHLRGERPNLGDSFAGFGPVFVALLLAGLISNLLVGIGIFLCVIPGIYLFVAWSVALPLCIDKRLGFWDAMEVSRKVINRYWWSLLWLWVLTMLLNLAGTLACLVGMFVTVPWGMLALMYAYEDLFGSPRPAAV